jgi:hypothetical protein
MALYRKLRNNVEVEKVRSRISGIHKQGIVFVATK